MRRTNPLATSTKVLWILSPGRGPSFGSRLGIKHIAAAVAPRRQPAAPRARLAGIVVGTASAWLLHLASTRASGADVDVSEPREGRRSGVRRSEIVAVQWRGRWAGAEPRAGIGTKGTPV